jgi:hypothetical protein
VCCWAAGWALGSYLGLAIQVANVGPLLFLWLRQQFGLPSIPVATYTIMACSVASMLALATAWHSTVVVFGTEHSAALIGFSISSALADCTSAVVFWPYVGKTANNASPTRADALCYLGR